MLTLIHVGVGIVVGAFMPSIGRKIKSFFVKESAAVKPAVVAAEAKVISKL